ncbi:MAG: hypothetical protein H6702_16260 [Myxococcales bacterium]|nr:hypothetical protein [Myxococcales bacterium]
MSAPLQGLEGLAELRAAGRSSAEAVQALSRAGGLVGAWAAPLARSVEQGVDLGLALARTHSLTAAELAQVGGPGAAGEPLALHAVIDARRQRLGRRRRLLGALVLPGIIGALTVLPVRGLGLLLGGGVPVGATVVDWVPYGVLMGLVWISGGQPLGFTQKLPGGARWHLRAARARAAALLGAGLRAGVAPAGVFEGGGG